MTLLVIAVLFCLSTPVHLQHATTPTHLDLGELPGVLRDAHVEVFGREPSRARLGIAVGQLRLEGLALPGRNLGGLEYIPGRPWVRVDRLTRLRAFDTYPEAARAYWTLLAERCSGALAAFDTGDPDLSASKLRRCGYFRSPLAYYAAGLRALARP